MPVENRQPVSNGCCLNRSQSWRRRLWSRNAALLLGRNTAVSTAMFLLGLTLLWLLVEYAGADPLLATAATFLVATSLHYVLGRTWIYRGTERGVVPGYGLFLLNAVIGLLVTLGLFYALTTLTPLHYLVARVLVSLVAGLAMFLSNAILNFKRL
ncbi:MAG: GtrA family protein [Pseudomonadota bacterium]|nr:GtrA family protein [Pseudomonadota bacterium]